MTRGTPRHRGLTLVLVVGGVALLAMVIVILGGCAAGGGAPAEYASPAPRAPAKARPAESLRQRIDLGGGVSFERILIAAGEFEMGSPNAEEGRDAEEVRHRVCISGPCWLARPGTT